jgi:hypothetical protein
VTSDATAARAAQRAADLLADKIASMVDKAMAKRSSGFVIPVLEEDPDPDEPTNIWALMDGRIRYRTPDGTVRELPTTTPGATTSGTPLPADPGLFTFKKVYPSAWAATYCAVHGVETGGDELDYGYRSAVHGERRLMIGFDDAQIRTDLTGAAIKRVEFKAQNVYSFSPRGVEIIWGGHKSSTAPAAYAATRVDLFRGVWPTSGYAGGSDRKISIPTGVGNAFRDDVIRGLTVDQPAAVTSAGRLRWDSIEMTIHFVA